MNEEAIKKLNDICSQIDGVCEHFQEKKMPHIVGQLYATQHILQTLVKNLEF